MASLTRLSVGSLPFQHRESLYWSLNTPYSNWLIMQGTLTTRWCTKISFIGVVNIFIVACLTMLTFTDPFSSGVISSGAYAMWPHCCWLFLLDVSRKRFANTYLPFRRRVVKHRYKWQPHSLKCSHNLQTHLLYHTEYAHIPSFSYFRCWQPLEKNCTLWQPLRFSILLTATENLSWGFAFYCIMILFQASHFWMNTHASLALHCTQPSIGCTFKAGCVALVTPTIPMWKRNSANTLHHVWIRSQWWTRHRLMADWVASSI